jgi:uncharacterized membrane protein YedE/YeeE
MFDALCGGALIGVGAAILWFCNGRVAGVSGLMRAALRADGRERWEGAAFVLGLASAGAVLLFRAEPVRPSADSLGLAAIAGVLVGFGARLGSGCTSGHGVCGMARSSLRSLVATLTFMTTGAVVVFLTRHLLAGMGGAR